MIQAEALRQLDQLQDDHLVIDHNVSCPNIIYINPQGSLDLGVKSEQLIGREFKSILPGMSDDDFGAVMRGLLNAAIGFSEGKPSSEVNSPQLSLDIGNGTKIFETKPRILLIDSDTDRQETGLLDISFRDITEVKNEESLYFTQALLDAAKLTHSSLKLNKVVDIITEQMKRFIDFDTLNLMLLKDESDDEIEYSFTKGYQELKLPDPKLTTDARISLMKKTLGVMLEDQRGVVIPDTEDPNSGWIPRQTVIDILGQDWLSYIGVPLIIKDGDGKDKVIGFLNLNSLKKNHYSAADLPKLQAFADQIAVAVENARFHEASIATDDLLTKLLKKSKFKEKGEVLFEVGKRVKQDLIMIMLDIDHFKLINDEYGHIIGDQILLGVQNALVELFKRKETDIIGRLGGEEFGIASLETNLLEASKIGERVVKHFMDHPIQTDIGPIYINVSTGVTNSSSVKEYKTFAEMIKDADDALYVSKNTGRNKSTRWTLNTQTELELLRRENKSYVNR